MGRHSPVNFEMACPDCGNMVRDFFVYDNDFGSDSLEIEVVFLFSGSCECGVQITLARDVPPPRESPATMADALALGFKISHRR
jgi:hypothetical protein